MILKVCSGILLQIFSLRRGLMRFGDIPHAYIYKQTGMKAERTNGEFWLMVSKKRIVQVMEKKRVNSGSIEQAIMKVLPCWPKD